MQNPDDFQGSAQLDACQCLQREAEIVLHGRIFCDLQLGMVQDAHSTPQVLCAMTMLADDLASASTMVTFISV